MSDTTPDGTRTLHAVPTPEPLTQLSGAPVTVYTELTNLTCDDGATVAELALAAGLGRSTTGKALTTLEEHGLAVRTPGGHDGPRRTPDRWRAAPTPGTSNGGGQNTPEPAPAQLGRPAANSLESAADGADSEDAAADEPGPDTPTALDNGRADAVPGPLADEVQDALRRTPSRAKVTAAKTTHRARSATTGRRTGTLPTRRQARSNRRPPRRRSSCRVSRSGSRPERCGRWSSPISRRTPARRSRPRESAA
ncbi:helix-turn-helix domain-containing protein [Streptomyces kaempferi]